MVAVDSNLCPGWIYVIAHQTSASDVLGTRTSCTAVRSRSNFRLRYIKALLMRYVPVLVSEQYSLFRIE